MGEKSKTDIRGAGLGCLCWVVTIGVIIAIEAYDESVGGIGLGLGAVLLVTFQPVGLVSFFGGRGGIVPVFEYSLNAARIVSRGWWLRSRMVRKTDISTDWVKAPRSLWLQ